ncbi:MAG TPA: cytochrome P450, partial [Myxococcota bacterium]|nr:cytochrome P450 [Myxococcota bacterium]
MSLPLDLEHFDPRDPAFQADPYPTYARLRAEAPVVRLCLRGITFYWVTRHDDVSAVLRDPRFSAAKVPLEMMAPGVPDSFRRLGDLLTRMLLVRDPPDHTRLRGLVNKAFTPRVVAGLRPRVERIVDELLDAVDPCRGMDAIRDLATPLPVIVIAELLGVATSERDRFKEWSDQIAVVADGSVRAAGLPAAATACAELSEYLRGELAARRRAPREDLLSRLLAAHEAEDALSEEELIATAVLILLAGHETTTNLVGNGVLALAEQPDAYARLRREPALVPSCVEEVLRYDAPVQLTSRVAREPVELRGQKIEA